MFVIETVPAEFPKLLPPVQELFPPPVFAMDTFPETGANEFALFSVTFGAVSVKLLWKVQPSMTADVAQTQEKSQMRVELRQFKVAGVAEKSSVVVPLCINLYSVSAPVASAVAVIVLLGAKREVPPETPNKIPPAEVL